MAFNLAFLPCEGVRKLEPWLFQVSTGFLQKMEPRQQPTASDPLSVLGLGFSGLKLEPPTEDFFPSCSRSQGWRSRP